MALKTGVVSDSSNNNAAAALDDMIEYMKTDEYRRKRDKENEVKAPKEVGPVIRGPDTQQVVAEFGEQIAECERPSTIETTAAQDDDDELMELRRQRLARLKAQKEKDQKFRSQGHGMYREVNEKDFLPEVTSTNLTVVHFFHSKFARCKVMDDKIGQITPRQVAVKFLRCNAEESPFFTEKLAITVLPCVVFFKDGVMVDRIHGFDGLCRDTGDDFPGFMLEKRICEVFKLELSSAAWDEDDGE